uniref:Putative secreted protein n=1 Tax=Anopheles darlingi TaxID=43151 RepID=A0A2M4D997_ANODA
MVLLQLLLDVLLLLLQLLPIDAVGVCCTMPVPPVTKCVAVDAAGSNVTAVAVDVAAACEPIATGGW